MDQLKIVIVDDEANYRKALERTVALLPECQVVGVGANGEEALDLCRKTHPDILLTDLNMPHCNGIELTGRVLEHLPNLKVVVITVNEDDDSIYDAFRAGALGYLLKTSTPNEVIEAIKAASKGEAKITPKVAARLIHEFRSQKPIEKKSNQDILELSNREQEILTLLGQGMRNRNISVQLKISEKTVKNHVSSILKSLRVSSRTEAAMRAISYQPPQ